MVNLVPAKCPNCGAQLELDDNMKRAECKFCKSTIIVDDAIAKYKIEISGQVEVDGVKSDKKRLIEAEKHIEFGKYNDAINTLTHTTDPYDVNGNILFLQACLGQLFNIDKNKYLVNNNFLKYIQENDDEMNSLCKSIESTLKNIKDIKATDVMNKKLEEKDTHNKMVFSEEFKIYNELDHFIDEHSKKYHSYSDAIRHANLALSHYKKINFDIYLQFDRYMEEEVFHSKNWITSKGYDTEFDYWSKNFTAFYQTYESGPYDTEKFKKNKVQLNKIYEDDPKKFKNDMENKIKETFENAIKEYESKSKLMLILALVVLIVSIIAFMLLHGTLMKLLTIIIAVVGIIFLLNKKSTYKYYQGKAKEEKDLYYRIRS